MTLTSEPIIHGNSLPAAIELLAEPSNEALLTAELAGLRYVSDNMPGIKRIRGKNGFRYVDSNGKPVKEEAVLKRIKSLVIPPAWTDVWICPWDNGHIQVTARDAKNRKQYRYHKLWREVRDEAKYERMIGFGKALPLIRQRVEEALALPGLPREKVLATVVYLLEATMMRIGNDEYARQNKSFGLTTLRDRHVRIDGSKVKFHFRGKSGIEHAISVQDRRLARIIKRMRDLPGQELFQYIDDDGRRHSIGSADINDYLHSITGESYTAKDFRTWSGTVLAAAALHELEQVETEAEAKKNVVKAIETVAKRLGNTPAICRKCYVHPLVISAYHDGTLLKVLKKSLRKKQGDQTVLSTEASLTCEEKAVLSLLRLAGKH
jgi:DNA topoisomerase-1